MTDTNPEAAGKTVKACLDAKPDANQIDVDGNMGFDMRLSIPEVIAREEADGVWVYRGHSVRNISHGHVDIYFTRRPPAE